MTCQSQIIVKDNANLMVKKGADIFRTGALACIKRVGRFVVAVSGGSTPRPMHRLLAEEPYYSKIPWNKIDLFWVDERCVPKDDPASNFGGAKQDFLDRVPIPMGQIHPMPGDISPEEGAFIYEREVKNYFRLGEGEFPVFDMIVLGIGNDGHTASLFPGHKALEETQRLVVAVRGGDPRVSRLTMTLPVLNHGRQIVFMVSGKGKSPILKTLFENRKDLLPAQRVRPFQGEMTWLLDKEAASLLPGERVHD